MMHRLTTRTVRCLELVGAIVVALIVALALAFFTPELILEFLPKFMLGSVPEFILESVPEFGLFIIATVSAVFAYCLLHQNRTIAQQKATLRFIGTYNDSPRVDKGNKLIRKFSQPSVKAPEGGTPLRDQTDLVNAEERADFLFLMNQLECMAVGLKHRIYNHDMIKDTVGTDLCRIYEEAKKNNLISAVRAEMPNVKQGQRIFLGEFEKQLIARMEKEDEEEN